MEQKFFFFDIDNTIAVWPDSHIPDSTQWTLHELRKKGHRVALCTGRIQHDAQRFADRVGLDDFVADGGYSVTVANQLLWMQGLHRDNCIAYLEQLESHRIPWAVTDENALRRKTPYASILDWHPEWDVFETLVDPSYDFHTVENFYKIYVFFKQGEEEPKKIEHMNNQIIRYGEGCLLFEPMDKAHGIRDMISRFNMTPQQVVTFGDGFNDLSMFMPEWMNIAMGNGRDILKAEADYITDDCDKDGIFKACRYFGWV